MTVPSQATLLAEALEAWGYTRHGVLEEATQFPDEEWSFRPGPGSRTVAELVHHVLAAGMVMVGELTRPDGDFGRQSYEAHIAEHAGTLPADPTPAELRALLTSTLNEGIAAFEDAGEVHMLQLIRRFDGQRGTRMAWLQHGIEHESYHRGQLAAWVRLSGRVPALTQLIQAG
jgi:uncharacterized damage-inducible protein DinB